MPAMHQDSSGVDHEVAQVPGPTSTVAAAGSTTTDAAALSPGVNLVTASNGTKGVKIPANSKGKTFHIINSVSGQNLSVYPPTGGTINYASADSALTVGGQVSCSIYMYSDIAGYSVPKVPS